MIFHNKYSLALKFFGIRFSFSAGHAGPSHSRRSDSMKVGYLS
jgi:hypothetical protein